MNEKSNIWLWSTGVAALTGAVSLYVTIKKSAVNHLQKLGMFREAQEDRIAALHQLPDVTNTGVISFSQKPVQLSLEDENTKWVDSAAVRKINQTYLNTRQDIIHEKKADSFTGAWDIYRSDLNLCEII